MEGHTLSWTQGLLKMLRGYRYLFLKLLRGHVPLCPPCSYVLGTQNLNHCLRIYSFFSYRVAHLKFPQSELVKNKKQIAKIAAFTVAKYQFPTQCSKFSLEKNKAL